MITSFVCKHMIMRMVVCLTICCPFAAAAQMTIGGLEALRDDSTGLVLCSVNKDTYGTDFTAVVQYADRLGWTDLAIDGTPVADGQPYTFMAVNGHKHYRYRAHTADSVALAGEIQFTYLPILQLQGEFGKEYVAAQVMLMMPGEPTEGWWNARIKWRGMYSNYDGKNKRNYHIKFVDDNGEKQDRRLFGLRKDNSWLLDGGQIDLGRIRNRVATETWMDFGARPHYADEEPSMLPGVRGQTLEVFLNNRWRGIYSMTEALDRKQLKLKKFDENTGEIHGMLFKTSIYNDMSYMAAVTANYNNKKDTWSSYELKYPDLEDVNPTDWSVMYDGINFVANSTDEQFRQEVADRFDLDMARDYIVLIQTLMANDNNGKNMVWACYDKEQSRKLVLLPWDLDVSLGQDWVNINWRPAKVGPTAEVQLYNHFLSRLRDVNPNGFYEGVKRRYHELRKTVLSEQSLVKRYTDRFNMLIESGAADREERRWSFDTDIFTRDLNFIRERDFVADYIPKRLAFLDANVFALPVEAQDADVNGDGVLDLMDINRVCNAIVYSTDDSCCDINRDGKVDVSDTQQIINLIIK